MTPLSFLRLMIAHVRVLILFPAVLVTTVFVLTNNQKKEYRSSTVVYTGLTSGYDVTSGTESRVDYFVVNSTFDNIIGLISSRQILERTGLRLLATHLVLEGPQRGVLSEESFRRLQELVPSDLRQQLVVRGSVDSTLALLEASSPTEPLAELLADPNEPYSNEYIATHLKTKRSGSSDMLEISYLANDPGIAQSTLQILTNHFIEEFRLLKIQEAGHIAEFFEKEVEKAAQRLKSKSEELKSFRTENRIINYEEQTKQVTVQDVYIETEYREELRKLSAAEAALTELNAKIGARAGQLANSSTVVEKSNRLNQISAQIVTAQTSSRDSLKVQALVKEASGLRQELRAAVKNHYDMEYSTNGLTSKTLVDQWLTQFIQVVEERARVDVMKERQRAFKTKFDQFAPLGSSLHNYEREIDVAEREYLELLHSLNVSRLRQQNVEVGSSIKIVDAPYVPRTAESSKRAIVLLGSLIAGLLLAAAMIVVLEYLDHSLRTPERAETLTSLKLVGAIPRSGVNAGHFPETPPLHSAVEHIVKHIKLALAKDRNRSKLSTIVVSSVIDGEGKSTAASLIAERLIALKHNVLLLQPVGADRLPENGLQAAELSYRHLYDVPANLYDLGSFEELVSDRKELPKSGFLVVEIPSLLHGPAPIEALGSADLCFIIARADRVWGKADTKAIQILHQTVKEPPLLILNGVRSDRLEDLLGEIPKRRSPIRRWIKRIARFEFKS